MTLSEKDARAQVVAHSNELDRRSTRHRLIERYKGDCPIPLAIRQARVVKAYRMLMEFAEVHYGDLIIGAAKSRMEIGGVRTGNKELDDQLWSIWQANHMDAESKLGIDCALTHGRVFAIVWPGKDGAAPSITLEAPDTVIVEYADGSRYDRIAATRRWIEGDYPYANLYRPEGTYRFIGPKNASGQGGTQWERLNVPGENWPAVNRTGSVPVVEIATNRQFKATPYGAAYGDYERHISVLDRIMVLEFLRLVIAFTSGFPIRALFGEKILRDDDGKAVAPFELAADVIAQFENPNAKLQEIAAGDFKGFGDAINRDVEVLAGVTKTPSYHLLSVPIQNVSADAIRASDTSLNGRVEDHKPPIGEGVEETMRVAGLLAGLKVPDEIEIVWINRESRSLAERADAATKLQAAGLPWQAVAELALDATQAQIDRWADQRTAEQLIAPPPPPAA